MKPQEAVSQFWCGPSDPGWPSPCPFSTPADRGLVTRSLLTSSQTQQVSTCLVRRHPRLRKPPAHGWGAPPRPLPAAAGEGQGGSPLPRPPAGRRWMPQVLVGACVWLWAARVTPLSPGDRPSSQPPRRWVGGSRHPRWVDRHPIQLLLERRTVSQEGAPAPGAEAGPGSSGRPCPPHARQAPGLLAAGPHSQGPAGGTNPPRAGRAVSLAGVTRYAPSLGWTPLCDPPEACASL